MLLVRVWSVLISSAVHSRFFFLYDENDEPVEAFLYKNRQEQNRLGAQRGKQFPGVVILDLADDREIRLALPQTFHHVGNFVVRHLQNQRVELGKRTGFTEPAVFLHHAVVLGVIFKKRQFVYQGNASDGFQGCPEKFPWCF